MRVRFAKPWAASIVVGLFSYFAFAFAVVAVEAWRIARHNGDGLDSILHEAMAGGLALSFMGLFLGIGLLALGAAVLGARIALKLFEEAGTRSWFAFCLAGAVLGLVLGGGLALLIGEGALTESLVVAAVVGGLAGLILRATAGILPPRAPSGRAID